MPDQVGHDGGGQVGHDGGGQVGHDGKYHVWGGAVPCRAGNDTFVTISCMFLLPRRGTCCFFKILIIFVRLDFNQLANNHEETYCTFTVSYRCDARLCQE